MAEEGSCHSLGVEQVPVEGIEADSYSQGVAKNCNAEVEVEFGASKHLEFERHSTEESKCWTLWNCQTCDLRLLQVAKSDSTAYLLLDHAGSNR